MKYELQAKDKNSNAEFDNAVKDLINTIEFN